MGNSCMAAPADGLRKDWNLAGLEAKPVAISGSNPTSHGFGVISVTY